MAFRSMCVIFSLILALLAMSLQGCGGDTTDWCGELTMCESACQSCVDVIEADKASDPDTKKNNKETCVSTFKGLEETRANMTNTTGMSCSS
mmetsp:Transcript_30301/g.54955  ORF Transcript_30301/g.54955 Transcript_30301/m.54955 type:complete len:92 (-) Transcript_30301:132-407(-)